MKTSVKTLLPVVAVLVLVACSNPASKTKDFSNRGVSGYASATGKVTVEKLASGGFKTTLEASGLKASSAYASHWHNGGDTTKAACDRGAPVSVAFDNFTTDASGMGMVSKVSASAMTVAEMGAYINIHEASNLATVPICADMTSVSF